MPTLWWYVRDQSWRNSGHHIRNILKTLQKMDFRGGGDDAVFFHQLTLLDSKQGFSSLCPLLLPEVNYWKIQIKYSYITNWHELARSFHWRHSGGGIWKMENIASNPLNCSREMFSDRLEANYELPHFRPEERTSKSPSELARYHGDPRGGYRRHNREH